MSQGTPYANGFSVVGSVQNAQSDAHICLSSRRLSDFVAFVVRQETRIYERADRKKSTFLIVAIASVPTIGRISERQGTRRLTLA